MKITHTNKTVYTKMHYGERFQVFTVMKFQVVDAPWYSCIFIFIRIAMVWSQLIYCRQGINVLKDIMSLGRK